jgi:hypothetical protein
MVNVIHSHVTFTTMKVEAAYCQVEAQLYLTGVGRLLSQNCHTATSNRER